MAIEKWNGDSSDGIPSWIESNILANSERFENDDLIQALVNHELLESYHFIRRKGNLVIYETSIGVVYVDLKSLLIDVLNKENESEIVKEKNETIKF